MAITVAYKTQVGSNSASSHTVVNLASSANQLMLLSVWNNKAAATADLPTVSGTARTWTQVATVLSADNTKRNTLFRSLTAGAVTEDAVVNCTNTQTHIRIVGAGFTGIDTGGTNGANAIVQSGTNTNAGAQTGILITLSAFASSSNVAYGFVAKNGSNDITEGSGFTKLSEDTGYPTVHHQYKLNDNTVDWSWSSESATTNAVACEVAIDPTDISKISGVSQANVKEVSGVAIASVKKIAGVSN